jgi:ankyrin repeat protein
VLDRIIDGRTDFVFEYMSQGHAADSKDGRGVSLIQWCAYYGDVSAIKYLLAKGESRAALAGQLNAAAFHGHWRLCEFLVELGEDVNQALHDTGETPLHAALCKGSAAHDRVVRVLLARGANPNSVTKPGASTGAFMRDCRTRGETPLHRAAAFGSEESIQLLLDAGAIKETRDVNGDSPLAWASWHLRPDTILRKLCYGDFSINKARVPMEVSLLGEPHAVQRAESATAARNQNELGD